MSKYLIPEINLNDYDYFLPKEKIAFYPLENRENSKLLFADTMTNRIEDYIFSDITDLIEDDALIILNETKVIGARLHLKKPTGGQVELLLVEPLEPSTIPAVTLACKSTCTWECIVGGKNIRVGMILSVSVENELELRAEIKERNSNRAIVTFYWERDISFSDVLTILGETPLPPYIEREETESDIDRYQTVYALNQGSVAAPTAGLHFTDSIIEKLKCKGNTLTNVTLHIGPGTFQPIETDDIRKHSMHHEQIFVTRQTVEILRDALINKRRIIAVGTTCVRTVESLLWLGMMINSDVVDLENIEVRQWAPYRENNQMDAIESLNVVLSEMDKKRIGQISGRTSLIILPGYDFRIINGLITNFHMPKSTLILLVSAFTGKRMWRDIYNRALENGYRFLSFGDSSYLIKSIT